MVSIPDLIYPLPTKYALNTPNIKRAKIANTREEINIESLSSDPAATPTKL
jgi:hypothetical protein